MEDQASRLLQTSHKVFFEGTPAPELARECLREERKRARPHAFVFLLAMATLSTAIEFGDWLIGNVLLLWFGVILDPFILSVVLQLVATLIGIGVIGCFSKLAPDSAARRDMLLTLLAAMDIGLILAWMGQFIGRRAPLDGRSLLSTFYGLGPCLCRPRSIKCGHTQVHGRPIVGQNTVK